MTGIVLFFCAVAFALLVNGAFAIHRAVRRLRAIQADSSVAPPAGHDDGLDDNELEHFRRVAALLEDAPLIQTRPVGEDDWARDWNEQLKRKRLARRRT